MNQIYEQENKKRKSGSEKIPVQDIASNKAGTIDIRVFRHPGAKHEVGYSQGAVQDHTGRSYGYIHRRSGEAFNNRYQMSNEIAKVIKESDVSDWTKVIFAEPNSILEFLNSFLTNSHESVIKDPVERNRFLDVCMQVMSGTLNDVQKRTACLVIISFYDSMLRSLLIEKTNKILEMQDPTKLKQRITEIVKLDIQYKELVKRMKRMHDDIYELEKKEKERLDNQSVESFRSSLMYAVDRWGNPIEKKHVSNLVKKIVVKKTVTAK